MNNPYADNPFDDVFAAPAPTARWVSIGLRSDGQVGPKSLTFCSDTRLIVNHSS